MRTPNPNDTRPRFDLTCVVCGYQFTACKSLCMECGGEDGHGTCPRCKTFLHLRLVRDENGEHMENQRFEDMLTAEEKEIWKQDMKEVGNVIA